MKNQFKEIKQALEYGHMVEVYDIENEIYCVLQYISKNEIIVTSSWSNLKKVCYDDFGRSSKTKEEINNLDLEIKIIPHIYKELPVGSLVDIIDCEELREMFEDLEGGARDMIGGKGYAMYKYYNDRVGQCYEIQNKDNMIYRFPAWAITPHIEEEKRETIIVTEVNNAEKTRCKIIYRDEYEKAIRNLKEVKENYEK